MNILLTNDDGYLADGINFLNDYFTSKGHNVTMITPDTQKSGFSHAITLNDSIKLVHKKKNLFVLDGTPADCTHLGLLGLIDTQVDLVISGINHGINVGKDIIYSGTFAAARQGSLYGIPSIAMSSSTWGEDIIFENVSSFLDKYLDILIKNNDGSFVFNVNIPNIPPDQIKGVKKTKPASKHFYNDELVRFDAPWQGTYYWIGGTKPSYNDDITTDAGAVAGNYISVSAIKILPEEVEIDLEL